MFRFARCAARRGSSIASASVRIIFVAIALLAVTVGVLSTESRLPNAGRNTTSWHTSKVSRMAESRGGDLVKAQTDDSLPTLLVKATNVTRYYFSSTELPLPEVAGAPQAHGLRAPPRI